MRYTQLVPKNCIWQRGAFMPPVLFSCNLCKELSPGKGKMHGSFLAAFAWGQFFASKSIQEKQALGRVKAKE
jgi:hypothetical protein